MTCAKRHSLLALGLLCATLMVFTGCGSKAQPKLAVKEGDSYTLRIVPEVSQGGESLPFNAKATYAFDVESVDASGMAKMKVTIEDAEVPGLEGLEGMPQGMGGDLDKLMEAFSLKGKSFTVEVNPDGSVSSVSGMRRIVDDMAEILSEAMSDMFKDNPMLSGMMQGEGGAQLQQFMSQMKDMTKKMLRELMSDESMREEMEGLFIGYPPEPVRKGDTWERTRVKFKMPAMVVVETYKVVERKDGIMTIERSAEILPNDSAKPIEIMMGMKMNMEFTGDESGTIRIDEETGWIVGAEINQNLSGKMEMGPTKEDVNVQTSIRIDSQKG